MATDFRIGRRLVQPELHTITTAGRPTRVEPKVMEVLVYLAKHPGEVVQRETLIRDLWGDTFVTDAALTRCIAELRKLFDDDVRDPRVIQTIAKSGYRLIAQIEPPEPAEATAEPVAVKASSAPEPRARSRILTPTFLVLVGVLAGAAAMFVALRPHRSDGRRVLRTQLSLEGNPQLDHSLLTSLAVSPDGSRIAYIVVREGKTRIFVRALDGGDASPMPGTDGAVSLFFSTDGVWVGFWTWNDRKIKKASTANFSVVPICDVPIPGGTGGAAIGFAGASWMPDGFIVFVTRGALYRVPADGGVPNPVAAPDPNKHDRRDPDLAEPAMLPGGRAILATQFREPYNRRDIVAVSLEDGKRSLLIRDGRFPRYVPTGHIVYSGDQNRLFAVPFDTTRLEITGSPVVVAEDVLNECFALGEDGTLLYVRGTKKRFRLTWVDRAGKTEPFGPPDDYHQPALSPDERRIAVGIEPDIYLYDVERGTLSRVIASAYFPIWTPDGKRLAYGAARKQGNALNLWWRKLGSATEERLTTSPDEQLIASWSPDARLLAFYQRTSLGPRDSFLLDLRNDQKVRCFTCPDRGGFAAMFSPDGRWVAFSSRGQVWVRALDGSHEVQISKDGGEQPLWSPNGKELFFWDTLDPVWSGRVRTMRMMAVDVAPGPPFRAGKPRVLFEGRYRWGARANYAVARDGRFLMVQPIETATITQVQVVINWFDELRARVRAGTR